VNKTGDTMTGKLTMVTTGSAGVAPIKLPPGGSAPGTPEHGDVWLLSDGRLQWRITTFTLTAADTFSAQTIAGWKTFSDKVNLAPQAGTPTGLANGDVWTTSVGMYVRINGGTVGPLGKAQASSATYQGYLFNATTTPPPASGGARLNNGTHSAATILYLSYTNEDGVDLKTYFAQRVKVGDTLYLQDRDDPTKWHLFEINAAFTDNTTYCSIPVTWKAGAGTLPAQRIIITREGAGTGAGGGSTAWADITGKPSTFPPTVPIAQADVTNLTTDITDAKARANHTGTQSADTLTDGTTNKAFLATERTKLTGIATGATANSADATLLARANHTGTQSADTLTDGTTNKAFLATERTKLTGIATAATANSADATLLARANHTGTQLAATVSDFSTAADARVAVKITNKITVASTAPGSPATNDIWIDTT
jgi:hypothetical protein